MKKTTAVLDVNCERSAFAIGDGVNCAHTVFAIGEAVSQKLLADARQIIDTARANALNLSMVVVLAFANWSRAGSSTDFTQLRTHCMRN